jgi:superfamily I DNA and/or RNA helicase
MRTLDFVYTLNVQYRMHREISSWPGKYFYGGALQNGDQDRESLLPPYRLFNLENSIEDRHGSYVYNEEEVRVVAKIVRQMLNTLKRSQKPRERNLKIGIITFYSR